ncbi:MAG TPA: phage tail sheath C-terminal domain-containing protein, partial [Thermoanaerobaculia bacterium]|nr:phage tail sheath C-terminal domain-containing protein [Thermoanaerobaculia bacterium]
SSPLSVSSPPGSPVSERLSFDLNVRVEGQPSIRLTGLTFAPLHPRYWAALPDDDSLYEQIASSIDTSTYRPPTKWPEVWNDAMRPRFPLASHDQSSFFLPIGMSALPTEETLADPRSDSTLERDGLIPYDRTLFLDAALADSGLRDVLSDADFIRYQSAAPRKLTGIHAGLVVDEATILAVPDAVHRGWERNDTNAVISTAEPAPPPDPRLGQFLDCTLLDPVDAPVLSATTPAGNTFTLTWTPLGGAIDDLEEATRADFSDAVVIDSSSSGVVDLVRNTPADYHYRLRRHIGQRVSPYSNDISVTISVGAGWIEIETPGPSPLLVDVQTAMLRMCAARGDLVALLTLPRGTREQDAIEHVTTLTSGVEPQALSYGAVTHPWLMGREENDVQSIRANPPDGATAGVMAARAIGRGAWVAPANEPLLGVVALAPALRPELYQPLQDAQINVIRQEPAGFLCLDSDTLSADADIRPINVRRLLILIRRAALDVGMSYVFEPNNAVLQRAVKRALESMLETMFARGALAGRTARGAFQVTTDQTVNTPETVDGGLFIAEVRVAPSQPLSFLTVRLVQSGDRTIAQEVR